MQSTIALIPIGLHIFNFSIKSNINIDIWRNERIPFDFKISILLFVSYL